MGPEEVVFRPGTINDIQYVTDMARGHIETGLSWTWTPPRLIRTMLNPNVVLLLAQVEDNGPVGFGLMEVQDQDAHLILLAVDPEWRGLGIGRRMIEWLEKTARHAAIGRVIAEVRVDNREARGFYRQLGYRETELLEGYYQGKVSAVRVAHHLYRPKPKDVAKWDRVIDAYLEELGGST